MKSFHFKKYEDLYQKGIKQPRSTTFFVKNVELATSNLLRFGTHYVVQWGFKGTFLLIGQISKNKFVGCK